MQETGKGYVRQMMVIGKHTKKNQSLSMKFTHLNHQWLDQINFTNWCFGKPSGLRVRCKIEFHSEMELCR